MKKNVIVFGAYGALGRGVVSALLKKDYDRYYLFDFNAESENVSDPRVININSKDLSVEQNAADCFEKIGNFSGRQYLFSTIGGYAGGKTLVETGAEEFDKMINMNLKSNFFIARKFIQSVKEGGAICFTTALVGFNPEPKKLAYGASKSALNHLVGTLALENLGNGIGIMGIAPYIIDTPANRSWADENEDFENWQKPEEIGGLVHFLFSNYHYLSGNIIRLKNRFRI